jgi:WD40 repeat protein
LGAEPSPRTQDAYQQILKGEALLAPSAVEAVLERELRTVGPCPYRGLAAFREADAPFFFGREAFVEQLEAAIAASPFLTAVVGASGSGKSSVVSAGLLPRLHASGDWLLITLRPGAQPFQALATAVIPALEPDLRETARLVEGRHLTDALASGEIALADVVARIRGKDPGHRRVLLVIDQFEELYTLCPDAEERRRFTDTLLTVPKSAIGSCLLTLRADFMGQALAYRPFADALQPAVRLLGPMTREELRAAIEKPAAMQGAAFEVGLVSRLLDDVGEEPGNLPLLEFALMLLWQRLDFGWMTHAAYEAIGRVEGALARYADEVVESISAEENAMARRIFTQLVQPGEGTEDTRRVATRADVGEAAWTLVQRLADQRLVVTARYQTTGVETVEVVHEALIRSWGQLQTWLAEDRAFRTWQERLRASLHTWESTGHDEGALLRGVPLAEAEEWLRRRIEELGETERVFVQEGLALRERRASEREAQHQAELEGARQLAEAHEQAVREREEALRHAAIGLASEARLQMQGANQDLAILLALEAVEHYPYTWQAEHALAQVVLDRRLVWQFSPGAWATRQAEPSPDGAKLAAMANDGVLRVWDLASMETQLTVDAYQGEDATYQWLQWSPSGDRILTGTTLGPMCPASTVPVRIWDAKSGVLLVELCRSSSADWSPDGARVVTSGFGQEQVTVWDAWSGQVVYALPGDRGTVWGASYSPNGRWIATSLGQIWDAQTGALVRVLGGYRDLTSDDGEPWLVWSRNGAYLGSGMTGTARVWDAASGTEVLILDTGYKGKADLAWSPGDDRLLITGDVGETSQAALWDVSTGERLYELPHFERCDVDPWSPTGDRIMLTHSEGHVTVWEAESGHELLRLIAHDGKARARWLPGGSGFVTTDLRGLIRIWRYTTADFTKGCDVKWTPKRRGFRSQKPFWSPDGTRVGRNWPDGTVRVWHIETGAEILRIHENYPTGVGNMEWSPDGERILTGAGSGDVDIWDAVTGQHLLALPGHDGQASWVRWSPDGRRALSCSSDHRAIISDTLTGRPLVTITEQASNCGAWSPDGARIVLAGWYPHGGPTRIWDPATGEALLTLLADDFEHGTSAVVWSPDGTRIVTFSLDDLGRVWDAVTGDLLASFTARSGYLAECSPSGDRFLLGGRSGIHVWDAATLQEVVTYPVESAEVQARWSPDGKAIAIAYQSGDLRVYPGWQSLEELVAYARAHCVVRELTPEERARYGLAPQEPAAQAAQEAGGVMRR